MRDIRGVTLRIFRTYFPQRNFSSGARASCDRLSKASSLAAKGADEQCRQGRTASKAGIEGLMHGYAARLVKEGITVNAVARSLIETDMMKSHNSLAGFRWVASAKPNKSHKPS
jgi:NAD(P)-dependent dehydrogenase (short-subunit alcohol dehydrogenase family)